jgi:benzylsuccinate CoA-transferase BbsE subunit
VAPAPSDGLAILSGLKVLDFSETVPSYAGRIFVELGADVVMVEPPGGSRARRQPPLVTIEAGETVSAPFAYTAAGKRSVTIDYTSPGGRRLLERLVRRSDVALLPPDADTVHRRRIDLQTLHSINDRMVVTSVTPFGMTGPRRHWKGSELIAWASSGVMNGIGDPDRPPLAPGGGLADAVSSLNAVMGTLLSLRARQRTQSGQQVDISMQEAILSVSMEAGLLTSLEGQVQRRVGPRWPPGRPAHGVFPAQDGNIEVGAVLQRQWDAMAEWIGDDLGIEEAAMDVFRGSLLNRTQFVDLINTWVTELAGRYTKQTFFIEAQRRGIPSSPINSLAEALEDPHMKAVGGWEDVPLDGSGTVRMPRGPLAFDGVGMSVGSVPRPGEHNYDVLRLEIGLSESEMLVLRSEGAI